MFPDNEYFALRADATTGTRYVASGDEAIVVPLTAAGAIIGILEPSAAFGQDVLVLPGGTAHPGKDRAAEANRELQEEIGYKAGQLTLLAELWPWSKYLQVRTFVFLARDLEPSQLPGDEDYAIRQEIFTFADIDQMIATGRLRDARVIAALYLARQALRQP